MEMRIGGEGVGVEERARAKENEKERKIRRTQHPERYKYDHRGHANSRVT